MMNERRYRDEAIYQSYLDILSADNGGADVFSAAVVSVVH